MKVFIVDLNKCFGCMTCQVACKDEHCGNDWSPYAKPQPKIGQFWIHIDKYERGNQPHVRWEWVPVMCQHCDDAPCITACEEGAIYKRDDGIVIIDPAKCRGQRLCVAACPYNAIYFNDTLHIAQKCTGCSHLVDRGWDSIKEPRCVDSCLIEAIQWGEESDFSAEIAQSQTLHPEFGLTPRVHYITKVGQGGFPWDGRFIAGTAYDPDAKVVAIGATCTLSGDASDTTTTDMWGDFWFEGLQPGNYSVSIELAGVGAATRDVDVTAKDVGLGDIPLS